MSKEEIRGFSGEHSYLSNMHICSIIDAGYTFASSEHLFQAYKAKDEPDYHLVRVALTPYIAKRIGRRIKLRTGWDSSKVYYMRKAVRAKFAQNKDLQQLLLETGKTNIVEGNTWHDNFWGDCNCERCKAKIGENMLGRILMGVREYIHEEIKGSDYELHRRS